VRKIVKLDDHICLAFARQGNLSDSLTLHVSFPLSNES
jgi:hypothetical protein